MSKCPITILYEFQNSKKIYFYMFLFLSFLLLISHFFLQEYLFMRPCEQCVYIRFAFCVMAFSSFIPFLNSKSDFLKGIFYIFMFFGIYYGINASLKLKSIYDALKDNAIFGISCNMTPNFAFNLPLDKYFSFFNISGECANDVPYIPEKYINNLSPLQNFFIGENGLYNDGWYLLPWFKFLNMADVCLMIFIGFFIITFLNFFAFVFKAKKKYTLFVLFFIVFLILDA